MKRVGTYFVPSSSNAPDAPLDAVTLLLAPRLSQSYSLGRFSNTRMRYFAAAEARNNFIAAGQNVQSCRVYLGRVKFPYATEEEMAQMEQAIQNAFNDIQSNASLKKALNVYQTTHKKVASLIQW